MTFTDGKTFQPPIYVKRRYIGSVGQNSIVFSPVQSPDCWKHAFPDNSIDWKLGWRKLWNCAGEIIGTGTDFSEDRLAVEIQTYFADDTLLSFGGIVNCGIENENIWEHQTLDWLTRLSGDENVTLGCVGIITDDEDDLSRPCLTLMVSGPGGAREAATVIRQALANSGLSAGIAIRTVRQESVGVVKIPFLPELYLTVESNSFGIDWELWSKIAPENPVHEWASVLLVWCDTVIAAVERVVDQVPLMIDDVYFDYMRTVPLFSKIQAQDLMLKKLSLASLMRSQPYEFLFNSVDEK